MTEAEVLALIRRLEHDWPGSCYDSFKRNCCHFSDEFCRRLGADAVPPWTTSLANGLAVVFEAVDYVDAQLKSMRHIFSACTVPPACSCTRSQIKPAVANDDDASED